MGRFIDEHGLVQYKPGQRFSLDKECEIEGCSTLRARFGDAIEAQARRRRDAGLPPTTGHDVSTRTDAPLYIDHCHKHGWIRGQICAGCNSVMRFMDRTHCIPRYMPALREEFRRQYNQCPDCEPLAYLPTTDEAGICQDLIWACAGQSRPGWSAKKKWLRSHPFSGDVADWLRKRAAECGLSMYDLVLQIAQLPLRGRNSAELAAAITSIQKQLDALYQAWAGSYVISLNPIVSECWQARPAGGRRVLRASSAPALADLLRCSSP
jgi:hypothetical protein